MSPSTTVETGTVSDLTRVSRCCPGRRSFLCRPSCGCCRYWSLRWRRFASTSKKCLNGSCSFACCDESRTEATCLELASKRLVEVPAVKGVCCRPQGFDRRVRNPEVPAARHAGRPAAGSPSHPHQEVPSQRRHGHVVPHLHVGRRLFTVRRQNAPVCRLLASPPPRLLQQRGPSHLVRHRHPALRDPEGLGADEDSGSCLFLSFSSNKKMIREASRLILI